MPGVAAGLAGDGPCKETIWTKRLCIICGSTNPITQRQLRAVHERGSPVVTLPANVILNPDYDADRLMQSLLEQLPACAGFAVTTVDMDVPEEKLTYARRLGLNREEVRRTISKRLGLLTDRLCEHDRELIPMLIGGDHIVWFFESRWQRSDLSDERTAAGLRAVPIRPEQRGTMDADKIRRHWRRDDPDETVGRDGGEDVCLNAVPCW